MKFFQMRTFNLTILCLFFSFLRGVIASIPRLSTPPPIFRRTNITTAEVLETLATASNCNDCQNALVLLQELANEGDSEFSSVATAWCIAFGLDTKDVCTGFMGLEGPILAATLRNMIIPTRTSTLFCNVLFGLCDIPAVSNFTVPFPKPKPKSCRPALSGEKPIQVVHISDVHVDLSYEVGSNYNCTEGVCCRTYNPADAPGVTSYPAGPFGNHGCDSPLSLEESLYNAIEKIAPSAAFTMFTGDIVEGVQWLTTNKEIVTDINSCYSHMSGLDLVYSAVGNHEANPVNSFPPAGLQVLANQSNQYMYDTLSNNWKTWIGNEAATTAENKYGAYSVLYKNTKLRIISINTQFYMKENFWLYTSPMSWDPSSQLTWLITELQGAEDRNERVYVLGHMPMGASDSLYDYSAYFDQIVQRYDNTIVALFFGHTHTDEFQISYSDWNNRTFETANAISYIAPALTPTSGNPTFRVYDIDPVTWAVLDYTVYFANMSVPNYQTVGPKWEKYYSVKQTYGGLLDPPVAEGMELTPAFWHNLTSVFESDDGVFQSYYGRKRRGWDVTACTGTCKTDEICQLRGARSEYACHASNVAVSVKRDVDEGRGSGYGSEGACPGSVVVLFLKKMGGSFKVLRDVIEKRKRR